jgi:hypothetical protein
LAVLLADETTNIFSLKKLSAGVGYIYKDNIEEDFLYF